MLFDQADGGGAAGEGWWGSGVLEGKKRLYNLLKMKKPFSVPLQRTRKLDTASTHQKNVRNKSQKKKRI